MTLLWLLNYPPKGLSVQAKQVVNVGTDGKASGKKLHLHLQATGDGVSSSEAVTRGTPQAVCEAVAPSPPSRPNVTASDQRVSVVWRPDNT